MWSEVMKAVFLAVRTADYRPCFCSLWDTAPFLWTVTIFSFASESLKTNKQTQNLNCVELYKVLYVHILLIKYKYFILILSLICLFLLIN